MLTENEKKDLNEYIEDIKKLGYKVFVYKDKTYGYITDGTNICYFELTNFGGISLSTTNKTGNDFGMCLRRDEYGKFDNHYADIKKEYIDYAFKKFPVWASASDASRVTKWENWEQFYNTYRFLDKENLIET